MAFIERILVGVRANLNHLVRKNEDPEKLLEQLVEELKQDLLILRQNMAGAIATQKRMQRQLAYAESSAQGWYNRAKLALEQGQEDLAREYLSHRQSQRKVAQALQEQLVQQETVISKLKENLWFLETKIAETKTKRDMYIVRFRSAVVQEKLHKLTN
ncbi:MAG: PspA/IM30 family protein [Spirulinaceae cyanobacterium]